jgi:hypothetical protein
VKWFSRFLIPPLRRNNETTFAHYHYGLAHADYNSVGIFVWKIASVRKKVQFKIISIRGPFSVRVM